MLVLWLGHQPGSEVEGGREWPAPVCLSVLLLETPKPSKYHWEGVMGLGQRGGTPRTCQTPMPGMPTYSTSGWQLG